MFARTTFATTAVLLALAAGAQSAAGLPPAAPTTSASADQSLVFVIGNLQPTPANLTVNFNGGVARILREDALAPPPESGEPATAGIGRFTSTPDGFAIQSERDRTLVQLTIDVELTKPGDAVTGTASIPHDTTLFVEMPDGRPLFIHDGRFSIPTTAPSEVGSAPASTGDLHNACPPTVTDCTVVTGNRIDLPPGHAIDEIVKQDQVTCPSGLPVGYSYSTGDAGQTQVFVQVWQSYPNTNDIWIGHDPGRVFFYIAHTGQQTTVQDQVGCAPEPSVSLLRGSPVHAPGRDHTATGRLDRAQVQASSASTAEPRYECPPTIADCTTVTGGRLDVPPSDYLQDRDIVVRDQLMCAAGLPVGFTYSGGDQQFTQVLVQIFRGSRGPNPDTVFFAIVNYGDRTTVQPRIGCVPTPTASTLGGGSARSAERAKTWTRDPRATAPSPV
jgi:hypothetical protein